jgi:hypothetical protein
MKGLQESIKCRICLPALAASNIKADYFCQTGFGSE